VRRLLLPGCALLSLAFLAFVFWAHRPYSRLAAGTRADRVVLHKAAHRLVLLHAGREVARYGVALGPRPHGAKLEDGDGRTPEGTYLIDFHVESGRFGQPALHVSYPSPADWARATSKGVDPGGGIFIEAVPRRFVLLGRAHRFVPWTDGSIGVARPEMRQIVRSVPDGTPIDLLP
jgi:murein L,D-transpeptidase YafK